MKSYRNNLTTYLYHRAYVRQCTICTLKGEEEGGGRVRGEGEYKIKKVSLLGSDEFIYCKKLNCLP